MCTQALRDCVLVSKDGTEFVAHRTRLNKAWPLAGKLMTATADYPIIRFELDEDAEIVELIVNYVNKDDYDAILEKWHLSEQLLKACTEMQLRELQCKLLHSLTDKVGPSPLKVWKLLRMAEHPSQEKMYDLVLNGLRTMKTDREFFNMDFEDLFMLLSDNRLNLYSEEEGYELLKTWIQAKPDDRIAHLEDLFSLLRFQSASAVVKLIAKEKLLSQPDRGTTITTNVGMWPRREPRNFLVALSGWSFGATTDMDIYSNYTECFVRQEKLEDSGNIAKVAYATAQVINGKIYLVGGGDENMYSKTRCFDLATLKWKTCCSMKIARCYGTSVVLNGKLYVMGGFDGARRTDTAEYFDPEKNLWKMTGRMTNTRSDAAAAVMNGYIYVFGGVSRTNVLDSVERYDPNTNMWEFVATMPMTASGVMAVPYPGAEGGVMVIGGTVDGRRSNVVYHFTTYHTFRNLAPLNYSRSNAAASCYNGRVYVAGGYNEETKGTVSSVEVFENGVWKMHCELSRPKSGLTMVTVENWPKPPKSLYQVQKTPSKP